MTQVAWSPLHRAPPCGAGLARDLVGARRWLEARRGQMMSQALLDWTPVGQVKATESHVRDFILQFQGLVGAVGKWHPSPAKALVHVAHWEGVDRKGEQDCPLRGPGPPPSSPFLGLSQPGCDVPCPPPPPCTVPYAKQCLRTQEFMPIGPGTVGGPRRK